MHRIGIWYEETDIKIIWIWKLIFIKFIVVYQRSIITTTISVEQTFSLSFKGNWQDKTFLIVTWNKSIFFFSQNKKSSIHETVGIQIATLSIYQVHPSCKMCAGTRWIAARWFPLAFLHAIARSKNSRTREIKGKVQ